MNTNDSVYVAGSGGLVGSAIVRLLHAQGFSKVITSTSKGLDLRDSAQVKKFFITNRPDYVFMCAAKVGGIVGHLNAPVDFLVDNLMIQSNVLQAAHRYGSKKLLFLGSACAYPKHAEVPITEESLLTGPLEPSNKGYALAKIAGIEACRAYRKQHGSAFISCMPTNLYGQGDNYHPQNSHVIPGMIGKFHRAKTEHEDVCTLWGSGNPVREFLHSADIASACVFLMDNYNGEECLNVGSGQPLRLCELALRIAHAVKFQGSINWDRSKPDGTPVRFLDNSKLFNLGWKPTVNLDTGLSQAYEDFLCRLK